MVPGMWLTLGTLFRWWFPWKPVIPVPVPGTFLPFQPPTPALGEAWPSPLAREGNGAPAVHRAEVPGLRSWLLTFKWDLVCPSEMFLSSVGTGMLAKSLQSCPTICDPTNCRPPGSSAYGILQARILEWVTIPSSRGSSPPRNGSCMSHVSWIGRRVLYH